MALTIRNIDEQTRESIDRFKRSTLIKTDSKALLTCINNYTQIADRNNELEHENDKLQSRLDDLLELLSDLESSTSRVSETLRQQKMEF